MERGSAGWVLGASYSGMPCPCGVPLGCHGLVQMGHSGSRGWNPSVFNIAYFWLLWWSKEVDSKVFVTCWYSAGSLCEAGPPTSPIVVTESQRKQVLNAVKPHCTDR